MMTATRRDKQALAFDRVEAKSLPATPIPDFMGSTEDHPVFLKRGSGLDLPQDQLCCRTLQLH